MVLRKSSKLQLAQWPTHTLHVSVSSLCRAQWSPLPSPSFLSLPLSWHLGSPNMAPLLEHPSMNLILCMPYKDIQLRRQASSMAPLSMSIPKEGIGFMPRTDNVKKHSLWVLFVCAQCGHLFCCCVHYKELLGLEMPSYLCLLAMYCRTMAFVNKFFIRKMNYVSMNWLPTDICVDLKKVFCQPKRWQRNVFFLFCFYNGFCVCVWRGIRSGHTCECVFYIHLCTHVCMHLCVGMHVRLCLSVSSQGGAAAASGEQQVAKSHRQL